MKKWNRKQMMMAALAPALALVAAAPALGATQGETAPAPGPKAVPAPVQPAPKGEAEATVEVTARMGGNANYRSDSLNAIGPLGARKLLDIPNEVVVLPSTLLQDVQARSFRDSLKYLPLVQFQEMQGSEILRPATRGMQGSNYQNTRQDGMTIFCTGANGMDAYQDLEVYSGLPSAAFGPSNPSGMFNFVTKRPTGSEFVQADLGYETGGVLTAHADLGGRVDDRGIVTYRVNVTDGNGTAYVANSSLDRKLASLGVDVRPADGTTVEFNVNTYAVTQKGFPGWFTYGEKINLPSAPDPARQGYGQSYAGVSLKNETADLKLAQDHYGAPNLYDQLLFHYTIIHAPGGLGTAFDYVFSYEHGAQAMVRNDKTGATRYVRLPDEISLGAPGMNARYARRSVTIPGLQVPGSAPTVTIPAGRVTWGITLVKDAANPGPAVAFLQLLLGPEGAASLKAAGPVPLVPPVTGREGLAKLPAELQGLVRAE
ncbi:MAG: TonB-dependent receptor plug domain-containing protein [Holophaga sp.]